MAEFEIRSRDRQCSETGVDLGPGSTVYSCLIHGEDDEIKRVDFCADAWKGPPEQSIGWWKSCIPERKSDRVYWAPNSVILSYFHELRTGTAQSEVFYLLTLLMVRKRILRMDEAGGGNDSDANENDESAERVMLVVDPGDEQEYRVPVVQIPQERSDEIQEKLCELLFSNEPPSEEPA